MTHSQPPESEPETTGAKAETQRRRGRPPARTAEEIRAAMISEGLRLVNERGLSVTLDRVPFDEVAKIVGAPRASAYRAWRGDETGEGQQARFHTELITKIVSERPALGPEGIDYRIALNATTSAIGDALSKLGDIDELTELERARAMRNLSRIATNLNVAENAKNRLWQAYIAITAGLTALDEPHGRLGSAWLEGARSTNQRLQSMYSLLADLFGLRLRSCYQWDQFSVAATATAEGIALYSNSQIDKWDSGQTNPTQSIKRATGPDGEEQEWTLFAIVFEALVRQFFEPVEGKLVELEHEPYP